MPRLRRQATLPLRPGADLVELLVSQHRARDLEAGRTEQPDIRARRTADRDHRLGGEQAVVARARGRRIADVVAQVVPLTDQHRHDPERGARELGIHDREAV